MASFDCIVQGGMIIDGTRLPRYRADIGITDGRIAKIGRLPAHEGRQVIDAGGAIVAPGFVDLHTHYDAQVFWDPYCSISGWHGVTSAVIGNCGFGFAPVAPEMRERSMLTMTRVEAIPYAAMKAGMPWDWVSFPEFLDSLERTPKGINLLPYVPVAPIMVWVMGLEAAKSGRLPTAAETEAMCQLIHAGMDAGGCGWSAQRLGKSSVQADYDGTPMVTDLMHTETCLAFARVLADRNEGFIQQTFISPTGDSEEGEREFEALARASGRPILYNVVQASDRFPERHRNQLAWLERCRDEGLRIYGQGVTTDPGFVFTFEDWNMWDDDANWREATLGTVAERKHKLADPDRRSGLRNETSGIISDSFESIYVHRVMNPALKDCENLKLRELAAREGKHPVDAMLDLAVADDLKTEFYTTIGCSLPYLAEIVRNDLALLGVSDGGAHTKFFTAGRYPTETIEKLVREHGILSLEEAHWKLSAMPARCAGFRDRGTLQEGSAADIVIYDYENLKVLPMEIVHD
ncbi:MAG: N-acyl-D-amino-acid deacylase family protein, partial [Gammaproteobacteria bacterium]